MDFSEAVVAYDIKVDLNTKGQDHLLTLVLGHSDSVVLKSVKELG